MTHTVDIYCPEIDDYKPHEVEFSIEGKYVPECKYMRNGDPGYEAEYPETIIHIIEGIDLKTLSAFEMKRIEKECFDSRMVEEWEY